MKRHPFDPVSFLFGVAFLAFATGLLVSDPLDLLDATWVWPAALIVLGAGLLLAPLAGRGPAPTLGGDGADEASWPSDFDAADVPVHPAADAPTDTPATSGSDRGDTPDDET